MSCPSFSPIFFKSSPNLNALGFSSFSASSVDKIVENAASQPEQPAQSGANPTWEPAARILFKISCPCASPATHHTLRPSSCLPTDSVQSCRRGLGRSRLSAAAEPAEERVPGQVQRGPSKPRPGTTLVQRRTWRPPHTTQSEPCGRLLPTKVTNFEKV